MPIRPPCYTPTAAKVKSDLEVLRTLRVVCEDNRCTLIKVPQGEPMRVGSAVDVQGYLAHKKAPPPRTLQ